MGSGASHRNNVVEPKPQTVQDETAKTYLQEYKRRKLEHPEIDFLESHANVIKAKFEIENGIKKLKTGTEENLKMAVNQINDAFSDYVFKIFTEEIWKDLESVRVLWDQFACEGLADKLCECASLLYKSLPIELDNDVTESGKLYMLILRQILRLCDNSRIGCQCVKDNGFLDEIFRLLKKPASVISTSKVKDGKLDVNMITYCHLGIVWNCLKGGINRSYFQERGINDIMNQYKHSEHVIFKLLAHMVLDVVNLDRDMMDTYTDDDTVTHCLMILHDNDISDSSKEIISFENDETFSIEEIAYSLPATASNKNHHKTLLRAGILKVCNQLMNRVKEAEQYYGVETIYQLSFNADCKDEVKENNDIIKALLKFQSTGSRRLKKAANGALSNLQDTKVKEKAVIDRSTNQGGHIMISYPWRFQTLIVKIKKHLERNGYAVWLDVEKMGGSLTESMAEAVDNASVVLICIAEAYYESPNCRREAEYAMENGKHIIPLRLENYKPRNWLGLVVAQRLYVDFTTSVSKGMDDLVKRIGKHGKTVSISKNVTSTDRIKPSMRYHPAKKWSKKAVEVWLAQNDLQFMSEDLTGPNLVSMMYLRIEAPEFFYDYAFKKLGVDDVEKIGKLSSALDKLESLSSTDS
ncbi:uncharacterized protein [Ptychodera flava]|uniref:uncharacterized protein n=1 Tax=Ptychodera flava TaxID=63121 RepID=UPI00396A9F6E